MVATWTQFRVSSSRGHRFPLAAGFRVADPLLQTLQTQSYLDGLRGGDEAARADMLTSACERLRRLTREISSVLARGHPAALRFGIPKVKWPWPQGLS